MIQGPLAFISSATGLSASAVDVGARVALGLAIFAALSLSLSLLARRGAISRPLGGLVKWLCGLGLVWGLAATLPPAAFPASVPSEAASPMP